MTDPNADDATRRRAVKSDDAAARQRARERAAEETLPRKNGPAKGGGATR